MLYRILSDALVVLHVAYVAFAVGGSVLVLRRPRLALLHLPCALWAILISLYGGTCPLTPLENELRRRGGEAGYTGGFVEHYVLPVLYPAELTRTTQLVLGGLVVAVNVAVYAVVMRRGARNRRLMTS